MRGFLPFWHAQLFEHTNLILIPVNVDIIIVREYRQHTVFTVPN